MVETQQVINDIGQSILFNNKNNQLSVRSKHIDVWCVVDGNNTVRRTTTSTTSFSPHSSSFSFSSSSSSSSSSFVHLICLHFSSSSSSSSSSALHQPSLILLLSINSLTLLFQLSIFLHLFVHHYYHWCVWRSGQDVGNTCRGQNRHSNATSMLLVNMLLKTYHHDKVSIHIIRIQRSRMTFCLLLSIVNILWLSWLSSTNCFIINGVIQTILFVFVFLQFNQSSQLFLLFCLEEWFLCLMLLLFVFSLFWNFSH